MPTWDKVIKEFDNLHISHLFKALKRLQVYTKRTTILYCTAFQQIRPSAVPPPLHSIVDTDMQGFMTCANGVDKENLDLILHTPGGSLEATKEIINYLRAIYQHIRVIVPVKAMSGGTMIACSSDEILMGPYSHLGPTDPQILLGNSYVPVGAIIKEFNLALESVKNEPTSALIWKDRLKSVPVGLYQSIQNMQNNSNKYLVELLKNNMLKDDDNKEQKANDIVEYLNNPDAHTSHGQGINIDKLKERHLNVTNLHSDRKLEDLVLTIYHISSRIFQTSPVQKIIANHKGANQTISFNPPLQHH